MILSKKRKYSEGNVLFGPDLGLPPPKWINITNNTMVGVPTNPEDVGTFRFSLKAWNDNSPEKIAATIITIKVIAPPVWTNHNMSFTLCSRVSIASLEVPKVSI